jgi:fermentation-respiration switch protein FrsA (DUF1100 family)
MSQRLHALYDGFKPQTVRFPSGDGTVVGHLYLPHDHDPARRYPGVAVGGSFSSVKEQMGGIHAGELARRGIIALALDYRNYGESSGIIRQFEDPASKAADLSAALAFLRGRSDVSGTGLLGVCTSGSNVVHAAAQDPDIGAVATIAGYFLEPSLHPLLQFGKWRVERRRRQGREAQALYDRTGEVRTIPAYHPVDVRAVNLAPMPYYLSAARGRVPTWRNEFAVLGWDAFLDFDAVAKASSVTQPTLLIHSKMAAFPKQAEKVFKRLAGPKELHWATGNHFSFYDKPAVVRDAADRVAAHFHAHLA